MSSVPLKENQCLNILRSQTPFTSLVVVDYSIKQPNVQSTPSQNLFFIFTHTQIQAGTLLGYMSSITKQTTVSSQKSGQSGTTSSHSEGKLSVVGFTSELLQAEALFIPSQYLKFKLSILELFSLRVH